MQHLSKVAATPQHNQCIGVFVWCANRPCHSPTTTSPSLAHTTTMLTNHDVVQLVKCNTLPSTHVQQQQWWWWKVRVDNKGEINIGDPLSWLMTNKQLVHAMVCQVVTNNHHMCTAKLTNINKVHHMVVNHV